MNEMIERIEKQKREEEAAYNAKVKKARKKEAKQKKKQDSVRLLENSRDVEMPQEDRVRSVPIEGSTRMDASARTLKEESPVYLETDGLDRSQGIELGGNYDVVVSRKGSRISVTSSQTKKDKKKGSCSKDCKSQCFLF